MNLLLLNTLETNNLNQIKMNIKMNIKNFAIVLVIFLIYAKVTNASNVCFFRQDIVCSNVNNCDSNCLAKMHDASLQLSTMQGVWERVQFVFGGSWTVVQTQSANWYSNWGTAAICKCDNNQYEIIFVQQ